MPASSTQQWPHSKYVLSRESKVSTSRESYGPLTADGKLTTDSANNSNSKSESGSCAERNRFGLAPPDASALRFGDFFASALVSAPVLAADADAADGRGCRGGSGAVGTGAGAGRGSCAAALKLELELLVVAAGSTGSAGRRRTWTGGKYFVAAAVSRVPAGNVRADRM
jgi:hypothetical protein